MRALALGFTILVTAVACSPGQQSQERAELLALIGLTEGALESARCFQDTDRVPRRWKTSSRTCILPLEGGDAGWSVDGNGRTWRARRAWQVIDDTARQLVLRDSILTALGRHASRQRECPQPKWLLPGIVLTRAWRLPTVDLAVGIMSDKGLYSVGVEVSRDRFSACERPAHGAA